MTCTACTACTACAVMHHVLPLPAGTAIMENMTAEERLMRNIPKAATKVRMGCGGTGVDGHWAA